MSYSRVLEVREDNERVYFSFYVQNQQKIIALPKYQSTNKTIYAGFSFQELNAVSPEEARLMMSHLMREKLKKHPHLAMCDTETVKFLN